jgi:protein phosphatase
MIETLTLPRLEVAWSTHIGLVRAKNEDAIGVAPLAGKSGVLVVVSDGMGGQAGGEVASLIVRDRLLQSAGVVSPERPLLARFEALRQALDEANQLVRARAGAQLDLNGMGATALAAVVTPRSALHLHVGDSRLYHFRGGQRLYRTQDHSVVEVLRQVGQIEEADMQSHPGRNRLLAFLGGGDSAVSVEAAPRWQEGTNGQEAELALATGDTVLICTDGLNGVVGEDTLAMVMSRTAARSARDITDQLVRAALGAGGADNVTVAVVRVT